MKTRGYQHTGYEITIEGHVWNKEGSATMQLRLDKDGYLLVNLDYDCSSNTHKVHRLVALTFIPNPDKKPQVNHIDGNKHNNHISNLEWVTNKENQQHRDEVLGTLIRDSKGRFKLCQ